MILTFLKFNFSGLPWWFSDKESTCQCRRHRFSPWSGKIPDAAEQLSQCATNTEPVLQSPGPAVLSPCVLSHVLIISSARHLSVPPWGLYYPNIQGFGILTHPAFLAISSTVSLHIQCAYMLSHFSCVRLFMTPWIIAHQALLAMGFSRQEYWSGLP